MNTGISLPLYIETRNGGIAVTSPLMPELMIFSFNRQEACADIAPTIVKLLRANHGKNVLAVVVPEGAGSMEELSPRDELPDGHSHQLILIPLEC